MTKKESKCGLEEISDAQIYDAIRDLNPNPRRADENNDIAALVLCASLFILLLGCLAFLWFYRLQ
jgi:hypothetical protein